MSKVPITGEDSEQQTCIFIQIFESEQEMGPLHSDGTDADCDCCYQAM